MSTTFTPPATVANYTLKRSVSLGYLPNGQILTGTLSNPGSGYVTGNGIALTGGSGTGATMNITATPLGAVFTGTISNAGTSYTSATGVATTGGNDANTVEAVDGLKFLKALLPKSTLNVDFNTKSSIG